MTTKLAHWGNSEAVRFPKEIIEQASWEPEMELEFKVRGSEVTLVPKPTEKLSSQDKHIAKLGMKFIERYRKDLEALRDK